jgi:nucleoid DNA-binding protein
MTIKNPKSALITKTTKKAAATSLATVAAPEVVDSEAPNVSAPELRKKELIDTVVARSGIKKRDAKPVIEAMLAVLGENVAQGRDINIAPMGKIKVTRMKRTTKAQVITMRLRRNENQQQEAADPIAQAAE